MSFSPSLSSAEVRALRSRGQLLEPLLHLGKQGMSDSFLAQLDQALSQHELVKIHFANFKEEKKAMAPLLAEKTSSFLVQRVGNVAIFFRPKNHAASA